MKALSTREHYIVNIIIFRAGSKRVVCAINRHVEYRLLGAGDSYRWAGHATDDIIDEETRGCI